MLKNRVLILLLLFVSFRGYASEPEWMKNLPEEAGFNYYIGRATHRDSVEAFRLAGEDALIQLAREHLGVKLSISLDSTETMEGALLNKRKKERIDASHIAGFKQVSFYREKDSVWVLYKIHESDIQKIKISTNTQTTNQNIWQEQIGEDINAVTLEIQTQPSGADIFIDDERWGKTPSKIVRFISPGKRKIKIDHPEYNSYELEYHFKPQEVKQLTLELKPAYEKLELQLKPAGEFSLFIDGQEMGSTSHLGYKELHLKVAKTYVLKIEREGFDSFAQEIRLVKGAPLKLEFQVNSKACPIDFKSDVSFKARVGFEKISIPSVWNPPDCFKTYRVQFEDSQYVVADVSITPKLGKVQKVWVEYKKVERVNYGVSREIEKNSDALIGASISSGAGTRGGVIGFGFIFSQYSEVIFNLSYYGATKTNYADELTELELGLRFGNVAGGFFTNIQHRKSIFNVSKRISIEPRLQYGLEKITQVVNEETSLNRFWFGGGYLHTFSPGKKHIWGVYTRADFGFGAQLPHEYWRPFSLEFGLCIRVRN